MRPLQFGLRFLQAPIALTALCLLCASAVGAARQAAPPGQTAPPPPVFRAGVDLVQVDVVVTDAKNQPISDLTAADFQLSEGSRPQRIVTFQHVSIPVEHRTFALDQPPAPSPDVATNAPASANSRLFVMIVDDQHIIEEDIVPVKHVMTEFLRALSPDDEVAMVFVGRSDSSVNFTNDVGRLLRAVDGVRGALGFGLDANGTGPGGRPIKHEPLFLAETAVYALKNAASALAGSGHVRRAIVFVSGFSIIEPPRPDCTPCIVLHDDLQQAYAAARQADVPIYTLDPRGVPTPANSTRRSVFRSPGFGHNILTQQNHLTDIATSTGGLALVNRSDLLGAVDEIVGDNGSFYLLGYSPDPAVRDGKFHPVHVTVARPGAQVRARAGYMAASAVADTASTPQVLDQAMGRGVDVSGLTLRAFAAPIAATAKGMTTVVTVDVTYPTSANPSRIDDTLRLSLLALDADAHVKATATHDWHIAGTPPVGDAMTVRVNEVVDLPSEPVTLRIGVASPAVGRAGTIQFPVDVPKPTTGKLQIGGIVVGLAGSATMTSAGFDLIQPLVPFQPVTTRTFTLADSVRVFAPMYWGPKDPAVDVTLAVTAGHTTTQRVTLTGSTSAGGRHQAALDLVVPLKDLSPGSCGIQITARVASGQQVSRVVPCTIDPPR
jgi:VWFA-related protein